MRGSSAAPTTGQPPLADQSRRGCLIAVPLLGGILLLLVAVALIIFLGLRQSLFPEQAEIGMPAEVIKLTPPVVPTTPIIPLPTPLPACETIISSGEVQVAASLPVSISVGDKSFPIIAVVMGDGGWTYSPDYAGAATWICGTVINYVVGLEPTPDNETLLTSLRPGDEIDVRLANGAVFFFRFKERREGAANEAPVFEQTQPRLTLIMEKEDGGWHVAVGDYVSEREPVQPPAGTLVQVGQPVRVGSAQVTVINGHVERDGPDLLPGTMAYLVEFSIQNMGSGPLDPTDFTMQLQDDLGGVYLLSPEASTAGEYGPLGGEIGPGTTVQGTAGYLVPETLGGPAVIWSFAPQPGAGSRASVSIPYDSGPAVSSGGQAEVTLDEDSTFLASGGTILVIGGEVRNIGGEPLTVRLSDITLTSSAGMSAQRSAAPQFPWIIQPGQAQVIELQYEKPDASTALLTILGYSFEIRGLP